MKVTHHRYGKSQVRVLKVLRSDSWHELKELNIDLMVSGDFAGSFAEADNSLVVATDSMKNMINVLAFQELGRDTEPFLQVVASHLLGKYPQIHCVELESREHVWERLEFAGTVHPHAFKSAGDHRLLAKLTQTRSESVLESGVENLLILKSTDSSFANFVRDEFTTLPDAKDRIFATRFRALWSWEGRPGSDFHLANESIVAEMLRVFSSNFSVSVQATLYEMATAALELIPELTKIRISTPNKHCIKIPLLHFGIEENPNVLFLPTDEPHGLIEATVERESPQ